MWNWKPYVSVAERKAQAAKKIEKMRKQGKVIEPVEIKGKSIAQKFWGKRWCDHLESFADYDNRLSRGRTYVRNGSVCHLRLQEGSAEALVSGSSLYTVEITIKTLLLDKWKSIKEKCKGHIGSLLDFLQGKISDQVMKIVSDEQEGLFPKSNEIDYTCSCPDFAGMCKHVAAVLYGIGSRLDTKPELLFYLRGVDPNELLDTKLKLDVEVPVAQVADSELLDIFGLDLEEVPEKALLPRSEKERAAFDLEKCRGKDILKLRKKYGLSVADFAKVLVVSSATIYRWEKSKGLIKLQESSKMRLKQLQSTNKVQ